MAILTVMSLEVEVDGIVEAETIERNPNPDISGPYGKSG